MDAAFPVNDVDLVCRRHPSRIGWIARINLKSPRRKFMAGPPRMITVGSDGLSWTDEEYLHFYEDILEFERERREQLGVLGRWPLYQIREWAQRNPEHAETAFGAAVIAAGITVGVLWHVLSPSLPWKSSLPWQF